MNKYALSSIFAALSFNAYSAETIVEPGTNTLKNAIESATAGDVLILKDGTYKNTGLTVDKNLTIKAMVNNSPVITEYSTSNIGYDDFTIDGAADEVTEVTLSGLRLLGIEFKLGKVGDVDLTVSESTLSGYYSEFLNQGKLNKLTLIGNKFYSSHWTLNAKNVVAAGNEFVLPSSTTNGILTIEAHETSHFIGNRVTSAWFNRNNLAKFGKGTHFVFSNRFERDLSGEKLSVVDRSEHFLVDFDDGNNISGSAIVKNNLFKFVLPAEVKPDPNVPTDNTSMKAAYAIKIRNGIDNGVIVENNIFDFGMDADDIVFTNTEFAVIEANKPFTARNNIVNGTTRNFIRFENNDIAAQSTVEYNLCKLIGNAECTGSNNINLTDEPVGFVDTIDYQLSDSSKAKDAGKALAIYNDVDGSRNDMGMYGGAFPINQYDVQREADRKAPYLYPLFEANKSLNQDGKLQVKLLGLARSK